MCKASFVKIQILQIAKTRDANLAVLEAEYEKRLQPFAKLESLTFSASKSDERNRAQEDEAKHFLAKLDRDATLFALDERGSLLTTEDFAAALKKIRDLGPGKLQLLIGGSHGLHPTVLAAVHKTVALSKMTFTHEMVRVFLKEQLYRAFSILAGKKYHK